MKLTKARLMEIIKEETIKEVSSEKQRRYMCAIKDKKADERPDGLSKAEAEEMCTGPMKKEELEEAWKGDPEIDQTGEYSGKSKEELCKMRSALKSKEKRTEAESTKLRQINFALRSKQEGPKFGKVDC